MLIYVSAEIFLTLTNSCGPVSFGLCNISNMSRLVLPKTHLNDADPFLELEPIRKTKVRPSGVFDFLDLPRELRDLIYLPPFTNPGHHITISNGEGLPRGDWTRLCDDEPKRTPATEFLRSCIQVYHEASLVFYGMNVFVVSQPKDSNFFFGIGASQALICHVKVRSYMCLFRQCIRTIPCPLGSDQLHWENLQTLEFEMYILEPYSDPAIAVKSTFSLLRKELVKIASQRPTKPRFKIFLTLPFSTNSYSNSRTMLSVSNSLGILYFDSLSID